MNKPIVSLCMPTNGVSEWVFPVLDSIFAQNCDENLFEVVVTDNGDNNEFKKDVCRYTEAHLNIIYAETNALPFVNEIESYKRASGTLIKFVNHRTLLVDGCLQNLIDFARENYELKPVVYFSNGVIDKLQEKRYSFDSFDLFVRNLSYWSSWSTGMAIWKEDFEKLSKDLSQYNELFPHTNVLFNERNKTKYIIDNTIIFNEMPQGNKPKGNYDLFGAFGIEYPNIIFNLLKDGDISNDTYNYVLEGNLEFIADLYFEYLMLKRYSSYDLSGLNKIYGVYYSKKDFQKTVCCCTIYRCLRKIRKTLKIQ